jgi:hypothetical protein
MPRPASAPCTAARTHLAAELMLTTKSKTAAAWLAVIGGSVGLHRIYLHGWRDVWAWLHLVPTVLGLVGVQRLRSIGQDDAWAWVLIPLLGLVISQAMLFAIIYALTTDTRWNAQYNPDQPSSSTGWGPIFPAALALLVGGAVLMGTVAYGGQKFFEWQLDKERAPQQKSSQKISQLTA